MTKLQTGRMALESEVKVIDIYFRRHKITWFVRWNQRFYIKSVRDQGRNLIKSFYV